MILKMQTYNRKQENVIKNLFGNKMIMQSLY
jgi:hypothetical protein